MALGEAHQIAVALLTGGSDKPYVLGLTPVLCSNGATLDLIGSDELECAELNGHAGVNFLNLRGSQRQDASFFRKFNRISQYYGRLIVYAATAKPKIFHILWNNKFEYFDRTLLILYYRLLGKRIVLTAHNVNAGRRDSQDTFFNRLTLGIQYRLCDHIFVHTDKMKRELLTDFGAHEDHISVIPFGINNAVPHTSLTAAEAKQRLGIHRTDKTILFFGRITPYKGLEYLIAAFRQTLSRYDDHRLIIAGRPDNCEKYWGSICEGLSNEVRSGRVLLRAEFIPDHETEVYFKAADALVLPYKDVYQSGVLFLGHSFGLPVLAADVGSLKDDIVEGQSGFVFRPEDSGDLARAIETYFASELYRELETRRPIIKAYAEQKHSWDVVARTTMAVYAGLMNHAVPDGSALPGSPETSLHAKP